MQGLPHSNQDPNTFLSPCDSRNSVHLRDSDRLQLSGCQTQVTVQALTIAHLQNYSNEATQRCGAQKAKWCDKQARTVVIYLM
jgi:hypothetical protein